MTPKVTHDRFLFRGLQQKKNAKKYFLIALSTDPIEKFFIKCRSYFNSSFPEFWRLRWIFVYLFFYGCFRKFSLPLQPILFTAQAQKPFYWSSRTLLRRLWIKSTHPEKTFWVRIRKCNNFKEWKNQYDTFITNDTFHIKLGPMHL